MIGRELSAVENANAAPKPITSDARAGVRWEIIICGSCHAVSDSQDRRRPAATCASCGAHHGDNPRTLRVVEVQIVNDQRLPQRGYKP